jgi:hypothetical protein
MKLKVTQGLVVVGMAVGLAACGPKLQSVSGTDGSEDPDAARRETISVGISVAEKSTGFKLAAASSFNMSLDGCASGLRYPSITEAKENIDVYKFDQGCVVKLNSFSVDAITYAPSDDGFSHWGVNDTAIFVDSNNANNKVLVRVASQLNSPVGLTDSVSYTYTQVVAGTAENVDKSIVGASHQLSVGGVDAANVDIAGVTMIGMTAQGAGLFTFDVSCLVALSNGSCGSNALTSLKYVLIKDPYGAATPTASQLATHFASAGTQVASGDETATGFKTQTLSTPDEMHNNNELLFIVQSGGVSYKYFKVNVEKLSL